jgi:hypothetical protein
VSHFASSALALALTAALAGCLEPPTTLQRGARVEGQVEVGGTPRGDAWLFLFAPEEAPPEGRGPPRHVAAVPEARLAAGDTRFGFHEVEPEVYRLWGFLDANGDADLTVDVLAQPGAGDFVPEDSLELNVQPGQRHSVDLALPHRVRLPLPAFRVLEEGQGGVVSLPDAFTGIVSLTVRSDGLGILRGEAPRFFVRLADGDGDGIADDLDGDGLVDLWPRFFLRFVPMPGQTVPLDPRGRPAEVVLPLVVNALPFLAELQGDVTREAAAESLQLFVLPLAQAVYQEPGEGRVVSALPAIPVGDYELWALNHEGGVWFIPNALGSRAGEPVAGQGIRFRVIHAQ